MPPSGGYKGVRAWKIYSPETHHWTGIRWTPAFRRYYESLDDIDRRAEVALIKRAVGDREYHLAHNPFEWVDEYIRNPKYEMQYTARRRRGGYDKFL